MDSLDTLISSRRSIRQYKRQQPNDDVIEKMLFSALQAPSPSNSQPVRFIKIASYDKREELFQAMETGRQNFLSMIDNTNQFKKIRNCIRMYWRYSEFMFNAPCLFAVGTIDNTLGFAKRLLNAHIIGRDPRKETDYDITVGLALQNFMLKGEELGVGTCILSAPLTFLPDPEAVLGIDEIKVKCFVTVGFPDEKPVPTPRKKIEDIYKKI